MKIKYTATLSNGMTFKPIETCDDFEVDTRGIANQFANRAARRIFGKTGTIGAMYLNSYFQDGSYGEYNVFLGSYSKSERNVTGRNFALYVRRG